MKIDVVVSVPGKIIYYSVKEDAGPFFGCLARSGKTKSEREEKYRGGVYRGKN